MLWGGASLTFVCFSRISDNTVFYYSINPMKCTKGVTFCKQRVGVGGCCLEPKGQLISHYHITSNKWYKSDGYTFRGSNSSIFASLLSRGQILKERICS